MAWTITLLIYVTIIPLIIADTVDAYKHMKKAKKRAEFWHAI